MTDDDNIRVEVGPILSSLNVYEEMTIYNVVEGWCLGQEKAAIQLEHISSAHSKETCNPLISSERSFCH